MGIESPSRTQRSTNDCITNWASKGMISDTASSGHGPEAIT
jgi:hypothetical protein